MADKRTTASPEGEHLAEQERLLADLTEQLAIRETEFATTGAEFARFRAEYLRRFAPLYRELDGLEAEIARLLAGIEGTPAARASARDAASRARESHEAAQTAEVTAANAALGREDDRAIDPALKNLFRRAAKVLHPDTAGSDEERERLTRIMISVNEAYGRGDADAIRRILDREASRPEAIAGDEVGARLIRTVRKIAQIRARFTELDMLTEALETDPMWSLFRDCREDWTVGEDPLGEDEALLKGRISSAKARLAALKVTTAEPSRSKAR
jgi:hypothetical protein